MDMISTIKHKIVSTRLGGKLAYLRQRAVFELHMRRGIPYFGAYLKSNLLVPGRAFYMRQLIQKIGLGHPQSMTILEIGSWAGSSAVLWAEESKKICNPADTKIVCVDMWAHFDLLNKDPLMRTGIQSNKILPLFLHNIQTSGHTDVIVVFKASSRIASTFLPVNKFDLIYVDADHSYSSVILDLKEYAPLLKDGGYICGDDLELQLAEVDRTFANTHREEDFVSQPGLGEYHPGVTLAVGEFFGEVSCYNGFWVVQKRGDGWQMVEL
jgi:predicted O-methyltransferase YrrM